MCKLVKMVGSLGVVRTMYQDNVVAPGSRAE